MFGTIIMDAYTINEAKKMAKFIDENCSPLDNWGWASAGIYSFWNYYNKEILYIGLASDLSVRFKQHNGLIQISEGACKCLQIQEYFASQEKLGYSILVQSPLSQPIVQRNKKVYRKFLNAPKGTPIPDYAGSEGIKNIREAEGQLIESYRQVLGDVPSWNKIGGDVGSRKNASFDNYQLVIKAFANGSLGDFLVSRSSIRELAKNATYSWFESQLHGLRMMMLTMQITIDEAVRLQKKLNPFFETQWNRIIESKYLEKEISI